MMHLRRKGHTPIIAANHRSTCLKVIAESHLLSKSLSHVEMPLVDACFQSQVALPVLMLLLNSGVDAVIAGLGKGINTGWSKNPQLG